MNELQRLTELINYQILDTPPENELDKVVELASLTCDAPISSITLVDATKTWFKSSKGLHRKEIDREVSFCQFAINMPNEVLTIKDALQDARFLENPLVNEAPFVRFYAGVPLVTHHGNVIGTLNIMDNKPRKFTKKYKKILEKLAARVMRLFDANRVISLHNNSLSEISSHLQEKNQKQENFTFKFKIDDNKNIVYINNNSYLNRFTNKLLHISIHKPHKGLLKIIHPKDLANIKTIFILFKEYSEDITFSFRALSFDPVYKTFECNLSIIDRSSKSITVKGCLKEIEHGNDYKENLNNMLFNISHNLRTPVVNILGLLHAIEYTEKRDEVSFFLSLLKKEAESLNDISKKLNKNVMYQKLQE